MRKSVVRNRGRMFRAQGGRCCYCGLPMWNDERRAADFAQRHGLSALATEALRCTAEHLQARQDGGSHDPDNLAAACRHCNRMRHQHDPVWSTEAFRQRVTAAMRDGRWHSAEIHARMAD